MPPETEVPPWEEFSAKTEVSPWEEFGASTEIPKPEDLFQAQLTRAPERAAPGFLRMFGRGVAAPLAAAKKGLELPLSTDDELKDYLENKFLESKGEKEPTVPGKIGGFIGNLVGSIGEAVVGSRAGPPGIASIFASQGGHDAFVNAGIKALSEGKSIDEALNIAKALGPIGATVGAASAASFPTKVPTSTLQALKGGVAPAGVIGAGTIAENIAQRELGLKTPVLENVPSAAATMLGLPVGAYALGRGLGALKRQVALPKIEPTTERPTDAIQRETTPILRTVRPQPGKGKGEMPVSGAIETPAVRGEPVEAKAGEQPAPTPREGPLDIEQVATELERSGIKVRPLSIMGQKRWVVDYPTPPTPEGTTVGTMHVPEGTSVEGIKAEIAKRVPGFEEAKPPEAPKPTIPPALDQALKGIASQKEPGEVWLTHGEGGAESAGQGRSWWTIDPAKAISYGPNVWAVKVKAADLPKYSLAGKKGEFLLPDDIVKQAKELGTFEQPAFELEAPKPAEPTPVTEPTKAEVVPELQPVGAATSADVKATQSDMAQLANTMENVSSPQKTATQRVDDAKQAVANLKTELPKNIGEMARNGVERLSAIGSAIKTGLTKLPEFTQFKNIMGQWLGANQQADLELRQFVKSINKRISQDRQVAITNYIQADGDAAVLRQRADASNTGKLRKGYEDALTLNRDEKIAADQIRIYLDNRLQEGIDSGILDHGLDNYITQIWKRPNLVTNKLISDISIGKLQPNFRYARQRLFESYFEGEQKGLVPANKSVSALIAAYDQSFNRSLAARSFIKNLTEGKASDGRPLVEVSGSGRLVGDEGSKPAVLVKSKTKPEDIADYQTIDHPALRKWKWASKTPDGTSVFFEGQLLVHPEIYRHLSNILSRSGFRKYAFPRTVLKTERLIKELMFSASGFHQVQETLHALGHRVNPTNLETLDMSKPWLKEGVEHGLQIADYNALENFSEGLNSGPIVNKIPIIGKRLLGPYTEWLFQDNIPRIKATMYKHAMERNLERFDSQLRTGKITRDQVAELTAKQANAAFGELNYKWMGRNPTIQDALRTFLIAPDFLEARGRFVGQAIKPYGREQLVALGLLAATQYITARILNQIFDKNPHLEPENAFKLIVGKHTYELRSVPGDILHLLSKPHQFATARISPLIRQAIEGITGRDWRGVKRDAMEQIKDFARLPTPISIRKEDDQRWWETFLNAFGVHERSYTAGQEIGDLARKYRESVKGKPVVEVLEDTDSPYRKLRVSLDVGNKRAAIEAVRELRKTHKDKDIYQAMERGQTTPFTGLSKAEESKFRQSLSPVEQDKYDEALAERKERFRKFQMLISQGI